MRLLLRIFLALVPVCGKGHAQDVAITSATVYVSPGSAAQNHTTILIRHGKIVAVGHKVRIPEGVRTLECIDCLIFAGFWNTHVHFTGPQWTNAGQAAAGSLSRDMQIMLTHSGFTTVVDTASDPEITVAVRRRIEAGEVLGPHIYTAGLGLYPPHGIPFYLDDLAPSERTKLQTPATPLEAISAVQRNISQGTDVVKLFTGSYLAPDHVTHMPVALAQAAVLEGHRHKQLVFAHPSDLRGVHLALDSGVDILAHAPDTIEGVDRTLIKQLVDRHMAMTPTLKLFSGSSHIDGIRKIVELFHEEGGVLLFGTDTGFLNDYDVTEEYRQLALTGLSFSDVLAMLTTNPAAKFSVSSHTGSIKIGNDGDLTILAADPGFSGLPNFSHVLYTIRAGQVIFDSNTCLP